MPGPCNTKKKSRQKLKKPIKKSLPESSPNTPPVTLVLPTSTDHTAPLIDEIYAQGIHGYNETPFEDLNLPQSPYIHDPGNGPRVRDTRAFLSSYFAQPPSLDDQLCAEFAQEEVLQMLCTVLPEETALILWYNKSRATGRICPACQRLYRLGDVLPDHIDDKHARKGGHSPPQLEREQEISGLCSPVCFILASWTYPGAIKSTWGRIAEEMTDTTWELLNSPGEGQGDPNLGMLLKMTRLDDLGLGQLCLPDVYLGEDASGIRQITLERV